MSSAHCILSNYPLSADFRQRLEKALGAEPTYLSIPELRRLPVIQLLRRFRDMRGATLSIPLEDENSEAVVPLLKILAGVSDAKALEIVRPDLSRERISRWDSIESGLSLLGASATAYLSLSRSRAELKRLMRVSRVIPARGAERRTFYLNANLWFGVKAGGSVGHVAGVANALLKSGYDLAFASAGGRQLVDDAAQYIRLLPPKTFGMPFETNYYRFSTHAVSQIDPLFSRKKYAFLYQRMSIANYTGVVLSRRHRVPLVLEYNGSEAWVAKSWGRPLRYHGDAVLAEDVCLKHAHLIVTVSEVLRDELIGRGVEPSRIVWYPNCIDPGMFDPERVTASERQAVRETYGIPNDAVIVEFVGTFGQWHGVDFLARAIRKLAESESDWLREHRVHFLLVGDGLKMPEVRRILQESPACSPFYTLAGLVSQREAPRHLAAGDILVSPHVPNNDGSRFFGSPTKLFEYMAMAKPILASDLDQIGRVLEMSIRADQLPEDEAEGHAECLGLLFRPGDENSFIAGLKFLVRSPQSRTRLGLHSRREVLARYTWQHHVSAILAKLEALDLLG